MREALSARPRCEGPDRRLSWAALISLAMHAAILVAVLYPVETSRRLKNAPDATPMVELRMIEQKGHDWPSGQAPLRPDETATMPSPPAVPVPPTPPQAAAAPSVPPPPSPPASPSEQAALLPPPSIPLPRPPGPPVRPTPPHPPTPASPPAPSPPAPDVNFAPEVNLGGTDSLSNVLVQGDQVIPAGPDPRVRNREPIYPLEAARRGEQGTVFLIIHVSPEGLADGVDIARSSGFGMLDRAAYDAVTRWKFVPAVRDGQAVSSVITLRVVFELN
jgi:periplasmic protein TonB